MLPSIKKKKFSHFQNCLYLHLLSASSKLINHVICINIPLCFVCDWMEATCTCIICLRTLKINMYFSQPKQSQFVFCAILQLNLWCFLLINFQCTCIHLKLLESFKNDFLRCPLNSLFAFNLLWLYFFFRFGLLFQALFAHKYFVIDLLYSVLRHWLNCLKLLNDL